jgi:lycopene cyclase domain-containing protein
MSMYFLWLLLFVGLPLVVLWILFPGVLLKYRSTYLYCIAGSLLISIPWDIIAVLTDIWRFPQGCCQGPVIVSLPIEEYVFICAVALYISTLSLILIHAYRKVAR